MIDHFDFIAPVYDVFLGAGPPKRLMGLLKIPCDGVLLDAGGGTGRVAAHFREYYRQVAVVDFSFSMLLQARKKGGLLPSLTEVESLPFKDSVFDTVIVVDALHHFRDQKAAVRELVRVLKTGGRLVIEEPDISLFPVKAVALAEKLLKMRSRFLSVSQISRIIAENGLRPSVKKTRAFRTWVVADK